MFFYPGSFSPPTIGHFNLVIKAANLIGVDSIVIVCSAGNEEKENMFTESECVSMWKSMLWECAPSRLPATIHVITYEDFKKEEKNLHIQKTIIRGIRDDGDFEQEMKTMSINHEMHNIDSFLFLYSDEEHASLSSTLARKYFQEEDHRLDDVVTKEVRNLMCMYYQFSADYLDNVE